MDHMRLVDYDDSSSDSSESDEFLEIDNDVNDWIEPSDNDDDGYGSVGDTSDPEEIYLDKRFPKPQPPPPAGIPLDELEDEAMIHPFDKVYRRPRELDHRNHPYVQKISIGYNEKDYDRYSLRNALRYSDLQDGRSTFNGFEQHLKPRRITGEVIKQHRLFYFVEWIGVSNKSFPIEAEKMAAHCPRMVIEFHRQMKLSPRIYNVL